MHFFSTLAYVAHIPHSEQYIIIEHEGLNNIFKVIQTVLANEVLLLLLQVYSVCVCSRGMRQ